MVLMHDFKNYGYTKSSIWCSHYQMYKLTQCLFVREAPGLLVLWGLFNREVLILLKSLSLHSPHSRKSRVDDRVVSVSVSACVYVCVFV